MGDQKKDGVLSCYTEVHAGTNLDMVRRSLAEDPNNQMLKDWLALNLYQAKRYAEASVLYRELIEDGSGTIDQHYYLGNCFLALGETEEACKQWSKVIERDPSSKTAQKVLKKLQKLSESVAA